MATSTGTVKWFNETKGFGFISNKKAAQTFLHITVRSLVLDSKL